MMPSVGNIFVRQCSGELQCKAQAEQALQAFKLPSGTYLQRKRDKVE